MAKPTKPAPKRTGRPPKGDATMGAAIYLRVPEELLEALDAAVVSERERTGYPVNRTDVARLLIQEALAARAARGKGGGA